MAITASAVIDHSKRRFVRLFQRATLVCALAALSACASHAPKLSATGQAARYADSSHGSYTPPGPSSDPWGPYIRTASKRFDVPQRWIRQVMRVESGGHEYLGGHLTTSPTGAMGLMQLEPATYQEMAAQYGLGTDPYNPYNNIMAGTAYIHQMYQIYGSPGFLAAYNAGPGRLDDYLDYRQPLPDATKQYIAMIAPRINGIYPASPAGTGSAGVELAMNQPTSIRPMSVATSNGSATESLNQQALAAAQGAGQSGSSALVTPAPQPRIEVAALTPPPADQPPIQQPMAPPISHSDGFALIPSAEAATRLPYIPPPPVVTPPPLPTPTRFATLTRPKRLPSRPVARELPVQPSGWAIQVGAYNTASQAKAALGVAELSAVGILIKGQPVVVSVNTAHGRLYRARYVDLPQMAARNACQRLRASPTGCSVVPPGAP